MNFNSFYNFIPKKLDIMTRKNSATGRQLRIDGKGKEWYNSNTVRYFV